MNIAIHFNLLLNSNRLHLIVLLGYKEAEIWSLNCFSLQFWSISNSLLISKFYIVALIGYNVETPKWTFECPNKKQGTKRTCPALSTCNPLISLRYG